LNFQPYEQNFIDFEPYGYDEAGRGPIAGPLSLAILKFPKHILIDVQEGKLLSKLQDSKKIKPKLRDELFFEIIQISQYYHTFISSKSIDRFGLTYCILHGLNLLSKRTQEKKPFLLLDGNYSFQKYPNVRFEYKSIVKGDETIATISAASIIAKVLRDRYMEKVSLCYPGYGFEVHKGYGTELHRKKIKELGVSKIHRNTFLHEDSLFQNY
jgi:ribonuclease HII